MWDDARAARGGIEMMETDDRGVDYDLNACLHYNPQPNFELVEIVKVLAVVEGKRDDEDWRWILQLTDGYRGNHRYVYLRGGCDFTGWDCKSWAYSIVFGNLLDLGRTCGRGPDNVCVCHCGDEDWVWRSLCDQTSGARKESAREIIERNLRNFREGNEGNS
jgi:hypothetical protein